MLNDFGSYTVRPAEPTDLPFIRRLYSITLRSQLMFEYTGLTEEQIEAIADQQLDAQTLHYSTNYPHAEISIFERDGAPVARLIIIQFEDELRLGDIMVLPEERNNGICTHVMRTYVAEGLATNRPIRLHVEKINRAIRLYQREGFMIIQDLSSHWLMEYRPEEAAAQALAYEAAQAEARAAFEAAAREAMQAAEQETAAAREAEQGAAPAAAREAGQEEGMKG